MRQTFDNQASMVRATKSATAIIETILKEMQNGIRHPGLLRTQEWERLFGSKQSVVMNLQKLVQSLSALRGAKSEDATGEAEYPEEAPLSSSELQTFENWLKEGGVAQKR